MATKTNATFKFGKMNKIKLGNIIDPVERSIFKKCMIDAQSSYVASKNRKYTELKSNTNTAPKAN